MERSKRLEGLSLYNTVTEEGVPRQVWFSELVGIICQCKLDGYSHTQIAAYLNRYGMRSWTGKPWCAVSVGLIVAVDYDEALYRELRESGDDERKQDWWKGVVKKAKHAKRTKTKYQAVNTEHIIGVHTRKDIKTKFVVSEPLTAEPVPKSTLRRLRGYYDRAQKDAVSDAVWVLKRIEQYNQVK